MKARGWADRVADLSSLIFVMAYLLIPESLVPKAIWPLAAGLTFLGLSGWQAHAGHSFQPFLLVGALFLLLGAIVVLDPGLVWILIPLVPALILVILVYLALRGRLKD